MPSEAKALLNIIRQVNINKFDLILDDPFSFPLESWNHTLMQRPKKKPTNATCSYSDAMAHDLKIHLVKRFEVFYNEMLGQEAEFKAGFFFGMDEAKVIVKSLDQVRNGDFVDITLLATLMGGQMFKGQIEFLVQAFEFSDWMDTKFYQLQLITEAAHDAFVLLEFRRILDAAAAACERNKAATVAKKLVQREEREAEQEVEKAEKAKEKLRIQEEKARIAQEKATERQSKAAENERIKEEKAKLKALAVEARRHKATIAKASKKSEQEARLKAKEDARVLAADDLKKKKRAQADSIEAKKVAAQAKRVDRKRHQEDKEARNTLVMSQIQEHCAQLLHHMEDGE
jgi:flagellar biosynthesis GTPase FlhF